MVLKPRFIKIINSSDHLLHAKAIRHETTQVKQIWATQIQYLMSGIADELRDLFLRLRFIESCIPLLTGVFELEYVVLKNQSQHHQNSKLSLKLSKFRSAIPAGK